MSCGWNGSQEWMFQLRRHLWMLSVLLVCLARYLSVCISEVLHARYKTFVQMGVECKFAPVLPPLLLPLGHTYTRIVCVGVAAGPRAWCSVTCVCLCSALGTSPQAMCTGLLLEAALYLAAWLAQALLSGCVF